MEKVNNQLIPEIIPLSQHNQIEEMLCNNLKCSGLKN